MGLLAERRTGNRDPDPDHPDADGPDLTIGAQRKQRVGCALRTHDAILTGDTQARLQ
jgi:hypothetical protein